MRRPQDIQRDITSMGMLDNLAGSFEGIASMRISRIKSQVLQSTEFFNRLWHFYEQIRVNPLFGFGRQQDNTIKVIDKELFIIITSEGSFSGDIDQKLVDLMLQRYDKDNNDIIVIGHHGVIQLSLRGVIPMQSYRLPVRDVDINVSPLIAEVQRYKQTTVFFQTYVSLMHQEVQQITISRAVEDRGRQATKGEETITEDNYVFEPSTFAVIDHLERSMMGIAISQVMYESKLAQYASRFRAMTAAHERAEESLSDFKLAYNRSRRAIKDERLKEIINGLRKAVV